MSYFLRKAILMLVDSLCRRNNQLKILINIALLQKNTDLELLGKSRIAGLVLEK
jgi:hypothetical protein